MFELIVANMFYVLGGFAIGLLLGIFIGHKFGGHKLMTIKFGHFIAGAFLILGFFGILVELFTFGQYQVPKAFYVLIGLCIGIMNPEIVVKLYEVYNKK